MSKRAKLLGIVAVLGVAWFLVRAVINEAPMPMPPMPASTASPKEKFEYGVAALDRMRMSIRGSDFPTKKVTYMFKDILPPSNKIKDHLDFFKQIDRQASRGIINKENHIYYIFEYEHFKKFGGRHFIGGDRLVFSYTTTDLTDEATIVVMDIVFLNTGRTIELF